MNTLTCLLAGCVTFSILGHIALEQGTEVAEVVKSGPGLVFLTYPEVVLKLPGASMWAIIFFVMLLVRTIKQTSLPLSLHFPRESWKLCIYFYDAFPSSNFNRYSGSTVNSVSWNRSSPVLSTIGPTSYAPTETSSPSPFAVSCSFSVFPWWPTSVSKLNTSFISANEKLKGNDRLQGGVYIFQLMDFYSASGMSILWVCFFQTIAISWIFGGRKFCDCIHQMMGIRLNYFWYICWVVFAPVIMAVSKISRNSSSRDWKERKERKDKFLFFFFQFIFIFQCVQYKPLKYGNNYEYPTWAEVIGVCLSLSSMIWIPVYAVYYVVVTPGSIKEVKFYLSY